MKVNICNYEVEVKAKGYGSTRFNKQDTLSFLCALYCDLIEARDAYKGQELLGSAGAVQESMDNINVLLNENNYNPTK